jgi:hypothetical protein
VCFSIFIIKFQYVIFLHPQIEVSKKIKKLRKLIKKNNKKSNREKKPIKILKKLAGSV